MKRILVVTAFLVTQVIPAICTAASARQGGYMSAFLGVNVNSDTDVASTDFIANRDFSDRVAFDPSLNIGATAGYDFGMVRLEGELSFKHAGIRSVTSQIDGFQFHNVNGSIGASTLLLNGFYDLHNDSRFTPYLGGGIGFASLYLSDTTGIDTRGVASRVTLYGAENDTVFAWQVGTGVAIALNHQCSLDLGYRYFMTGKGNFDSDLGIATSMRFVGHNVAAGIRLNF